jgi:hypothetical protein
MIKLIQILLFLIIKLTVLCNKLKLTKLTTHANNFNNLNNNNDIHDLMKSEDFLLFESSVKCKQNCNLLENSPICATNNQTYKNKCLLNYTNCIDNKNFKINCLNACPCHKNKSDNLIIIFSCATKNSPEICLKNAYLNENKHLFDKISIANYLSCFETIKYLINENILINTIQSRIVFMQQNDTCLSKFIKLCDTLYKSDNSKQKDFLKCLKRLS